MGVGSAPATPLKDEQQRLKKNRRFGFLVNTESHPALDLPIDENEKDTVMESDRAEATFKEEQEPRDAKEGKQGN